MPIGGGSTIDCAKAIAVGVFYDGDAWDIVKNNELITDALPIVSVLTVVAIGSEMDSSSVISNAAECDKAEINADILYPKCSILDPSYTFTVPVYQTGVMVMTTERDVTSEPEGRKSNIEKEKTEVSFLYLSEEDMVDAGVLNAARCVDVMEETIGLMEDGDFIMGGPYNDAHGLMLYFPKKSPIENFPINNSRDRSFIAMPAYLGGRFHIAGEKWYGSNGDNRRKGLPRSILMVMLNDVETGKPLAYMSGSLLSSMRTGAMPGSKAGVDEAGLIERDSITQTGQPQDFAKTIQMYWNRNSFVL